MLEQNYISELLKCTFRDTLEITKSFNFEINTLSRFKIQNFLKGIQWKKHLDRTTQDKFPRGKDVYQFPVWPTKAILCTYTFMIVSVPRALHRRSSSQYQRIPLASSQRKVHFLKLWLLLRKTLRVRHLYWIGLKILTIFY